MNTTRAFGLPKRSTTAEYSQHMMLLRKVARYLEQDPATGHTSVVNHALAGELHAAADKLLRRANWLPGLEELGHD